MSVSRGCRPKLPPTGRLKTAEMCCVTVLRARSLKPRWGRGPPPSTGSRGESLFQLLVAPGFKEGGFLGLWPHHSSLRLPLHTASPLHLLIFCLISGHVLSLYPGPIQIIQMISSPDSSLHLQGPFSKEGHGYQLQGLGYDHKLGGGHHQPSTTLCLLTVQIIPHHLVRLKCSNAFSRQVPERE